MKLLNNILCFLKFSERQEFPYLGFFIKLKNNLFLEKVQKNSSNITNLLIISNYK